MVSVNAQRAPIEGQNDRTAAPPCPITGAPPVRRVQWLSTKVLAAIWRWSVGVDVRALFAGVDRVGLWESPDGLLYCDPPIAGNDAFYQSFYRNVRMHGRLSHTAAPRGEFTLAASFIDPGTRVLDVGCGGGGLSRYVPEAHYTGLDMHFGSEAPLVLAETIEAHAARCPQAYDTVCALEVIEHVPDPVAFTATMLEALRPGGRLIIGVPCWPSPMTDIPNFVVNAPPHHLTLWSERALRALADRLGVRVHAIRPIPVTAELAIAYWMSRIAPKASSRLFSADWSWHARLAVAYLAGSIVKSVRSIPVDAPPISLLLVADKP
jgi:SAM-dependent methyltransferase